MDLEALSDAELEELANKATRLIKSRKKIYLLALPCDCDRYKCSRCQQLDGLKFVPPHKENW